MDASDFFVDAQILDVEGCEDVYKDLPAEVIFLAPFRHDYRRIHDIGKTHLEIVNGGHRDGKSLYSSFKSTVTDSTFWKYMDWRLAYSANAIIRSMERNRKKNIYGGFTIPDECGAGSMAAREYYSEMNRAINAALQIYGKWLIGCMFTSIDMSFIDSQARKMFNFGTNKKNGKPFFKYPIYRIKFEGEYRTFRLKGLRIKKYPQEFIDRYEEISIPEKEKLLQLQEERISGALHEDGRIKDKDRLSVEQIKQFIVDNYEQFVNKKEFEKGIVKIVKSSVDFEFSKQIPARHVSGLCHVVEGMIEAKFGKQISENRKAEEER
jgi:hypothetical protein